jgi:hypothetical protein
MSARHQNIMIHPVKKIFVWLPDFQKMFNSWVEECEKHTLWQYNFWTIKGWYRKLNIKITNQTHLYSHKIKIWNCDLSWTPFTASVVCTYLHDKVVVVLCSQNDPNMSAFILQPSSEQCNVTPLKWNLVQPIQDSLSWRWKLLPWQIITSSHSNEGITVCLKFTDR